MKRPSFQFYPADWAGNSNLRRCSHAEKGAWIDVMCLMHDQAEYGILRWPLKEIAQAIGAPLSILRALVSKAVLKGDDEELAEAFVYVPRSGRKDGAPVTLVPPQAGPVWYSSRMVKDEYVRTIRGESSRFSGDEGDAPMLPEKPAPKAPFGDGSSSSSSPSPSGDIQPPTSSVPRVRSKAPGKRPLPEGWRPRPADVDRLAEQFHLSGSVIAGAYVESFRDACAAKGYEYSDFDAAFRNCVRQDWPKLRPVNGAQRPVLDADDVFEGRH